MNLSIESRAGTRACAWSGYALLRDNVQHFIEGGKPSERFAALHGIETAVDSGHCRVDAARLRGEVLRAWYALCRISVDDAAVSIRTRAILTGSSKSPAARGTVNARRTGWRLAGPDDGANTVTASARSFVASVLSLTETAVDGETVEIRRQGPPPRFVRKPSRPPQRRGGNRPFPAARLAGGPTARLHAAFVGPSTK